MGSLASNQLPISHSYNTRETARAPVLSGQPEKRSLLSMAGVLSLLHPNQVCKYVNRIPSQAHSLLLLHQRRKTTSTEIQIYQKTAEASAWKWYFLYSMNKHSTFTFPVPLKFSRCSLIPVSHQDTEFFLSPILCYRSEKLLIWRTWGTTGLFLYCLYTEGKRNYE